MSSPPHRLSLYFWLLPVVYGNYSILSFLITFLSLSFECHRRCHHLGHCQATSPVSVPALELQVFRFYISVSHPSSIPSWFLCYKGLICCFGSVLNDSSVSFTEEIVISAHALLAVLSMENWLKCTDLFLESVLLNWCTCVFWSISTYFKDSTEKKELAHMQNMKNIYLKCIKNYILDDIRRNHCPWTFFVSVNKPNSVSEIFTRLLHKVPILLPTVLLDVLCMYVCVWGGLFICAIHLW